MYLTHLHGITFDTPRGPVFQLTDEDLEILNRKHDNIAFRMVVDERRDAMGARLSAQNVARYGQSFRNAAITLIRSQLERDGVASKHSVF